MRETRLYIKCDRCEVETSVAIKNKDIENGKTIETYDYPKDWGKTPDDKDLCPDCFKQYLDLQKRFFKK